MSKLIIRAALANTGAELKTDELLDFLMENTTDAEFYKLQPTPGAIMAAAFDWQMILGSTSSIVTIAGALWAAYKKLILPLKKKGKEDAFLFVAVENDKKEYEQFTIGHEYQSEEIFIREFAQKVTTIRNKTNPDEMESEIREIHSLTTWKKIKKRRYQ